MTGHKRRRSPSPLNRERLSELALAYVGRFATSRAKLATYLNRKLRERGWDGEGAADIDGLVERLASLGYVDDQAFALSKARSLTARGYGQRRVGQALRAAGIDEQDGAAARDLAGEAAVDAAIKYAQRKRIGPFAVTVFDPRQRERALASMIRAGHPFALSRTIVETAPGEEIDKEMLASAG